MLGPECVYEQDKSLTSCFGHFGLYLHGCIISISDLDPDLDLSSTTETLGIELIEYTIWYVHEQSMF